jgi:hypothetical protein
MVPRRVQIPWLSTNNNPPSLVDSRVREFFESGLGAGGVGAGGVGFWKFGLECLGECFEGMSGAMGSGLGHAEGEISPPVSGRLTESFRR